MKYFKLIALVLVIALLSGCYGNFSLTRKIYNWNGSVENKPMKTVVMWAMAIIPIYSSCMFIDYALLNTIEFWTGNNPIAMSEGEKETKIIASNNKEYSITAEKNRFVIEVLSGENKGQISVLEYNPQSKKFTFENDSKKMDVAQVISDDKIEVIFSDGETVSFNLNN